MQVKSQSPVSVIEANAMSTNSKLEKRRFGNYSGIKKVWKLHSQPLGTKLPSSLCRYSVFAYMYDHPVIGLVARFPYFPVRCKRITYVPIFLWLLGSISALRIEGGEMTKLRD